MLRGSTIDRRPCPALTHVVLVAMFTLLLVGATPLLAQQARLHTGAGPHYSEVPIPLQIRIEGFEEEPQPEIEPVDEGRNISLRRISVDPQVSSFLRIVNGRRSETRTVVWTANYELLVLEPGPFEIPAFEIVQGSTRAVTRSRALVATEVPVSDRVEVSLELPERPVRPGQRIPVTLRMSFDAALQDRYGGHSIRSALFDRDRDFDFTGTEPRRGEPALEIASASGERRLRARATRRETPDGAWIDVTAEFTVVPLRPGAFEFPATTVLFTEVTRWRRGILPSDRRAAETRLLLARDFARRLVVEPLPAAGRPDSFAGAVGRGFSLAVEADRTVLQVGDPVQLTLTLRGDGNLENAGLPDLAAAGLPEGAFQVPDGTPPGIFENGSKTFRVTVRVRDAAIDEIPPLEYAWFDPEAEVYRTTNAEPIALSVRRGETVGADAVIGAPTPSGDGASGADSVRGPGSGRPRFTLVGADLAIEPDLAVLVASERDRFGGPPARTAIYALSVLLVFGAFGVRLRDRVPPAVRERRTRLAESARAVVAASRAVDVEALRTIAGTLRTMHREVRSAGGRSPEGLEPFLSECETRIYDPQGTAEAIEELASRARDLARALEEAGR